MIKQKTLAQEIAFKGVGLHTGEEATIVFRPAEVNSGLVFVREDLPGRPRIPVHVSNANLNERLHTSLSANGAEVKTVEHVLATAVGLGIDNIEFGITSSEVPILDGSAGPFTEAVLKAGIVELDATRQYLEVLEPVWFLDSNVELSVTPSDYLEATFKVDYSHPAVGIKAASFRITPEIFAKEIAPARTFCFKSDVDKLLAAGLIKGGSLDNAIVIDENGVMNDDLRFHDEIARHKLLDLLGDLALIGRPLKGHFVAVRSGHAYNARFVDKLLKEVRKQAMKWPPELPMSADVIRSILPHRFPFLLVDRLLEVSEDFTRAKGIKNVTINEPFFAGHFPQRAVMPGVLLIEATAQVGGIVLLAKSENRGKLAFLLSIEDFKFRKPVVPGDQLEIDVEVVRAKKKFGKVKGTCQVDGNVVAEGFINFAIVDSE